MFKWRKKIEKKIEAGKKFRTKIIFFCHMTEKFLTSSILCVFVVDVDRLDTDLDLLHCI